MKDFYKHIQALLVICLLAGMSTLSAQSQSDTLVVDWLNEAGTEVLQNSLFETIIADTNSTGDRLNPNRVYQLQESGFYYVTERITNEGWHLNIVGEKPDPNNSDSFAPAIQLNHREDNSRPGKLISAEGDLTIKNVTLLGMSTAGDYPYEVYEMQGSDIRLIFDNVTFEKAQWGFFGVYGAGTDLYITNSRFRNLASHTQIFGGRGFSTWADMDTVWVENNTFLNVNGFPIQVEGGTAELLWINQNTFINAGRNVVLGAWVKNMVFTNNLIQNPFWQGESAAEITADRLASDDEQYSGLFNFDNIPSRYGLDAERKIAIANNSFFLESEYPAYYSADNDTFNIRKQPLLNVRQQNLFNEDLNSNWIVKDNLFDEEDPGFTNYPDNHNARIQLITDLRNGNEPSEYGYWYPNGPAGQAGIEVIFSPDPPENLTYSNSALQSAAIGGYPLGDLNWYPSAKSQWQANREAQKTEIMDIFGNEITSEFVAQLESENGSFSGNAEAKAAANRQIVRIEGNGNLVWDEATIGTAGSYDLKVFQRTWYSDSNTGRQTDVVVNDGGVIPLQIGEVQDGVTWSEPVVAGVTLEQGVNTIRLNKNWGFLEYQKVEILEAGTDNVVTTLWPVDATLEGGGTLRCEESFVCASGDRFVEVTGDATVNTPFDAAEAGQYVLKFEYMVEGSVPVTININGSEESVTLSGEAETWNTLDLVGVELSQGQNDIEVNYTGTATFSLDFVDVLKIEGFTPVSIEDETLASEFKLSQNYPNPFNPTTNISFNLPQASDVSLTIYNVIGQRVAVLANEVLQSGAHTYNFDASSLASGMYLYRLQTENFSTTKKMMLIK
jgi:hypothetical protein